MTDYGNILQCPSQLIDDLKSCLLSVSAVAHPFQYLSTSDIVSHYNVSNSKRNSTMKNSQTILQLESYKKVKQRLFCVVKGRETEKVISSQSKLRA